MKRKAKVALPVEAVAQNVLIARGLAAAVFRVDSVSYEFLGEMDKKRLWEKLAWWMLKVEANFSIYRVCREYPAERYVQDTVSLIDERFADRAAWEALLDQHAQRLRGMRSYEPELYFVVSLNARSRIPWRGASQDSQMMRDAEQESLDLIRSYLPARRATTLELQWLLRRVAVRGAREPDLDPHWSPPALSLEGGIWSPGRADVQRFMASVEKQGRRVYVEGEDGESYQSFLALGGFPVHAEFPGDSELLYAPLEKLDFAVDSVTPTSRCRARPTTPCATAPTQSTTLPRAIWTSRPSITQSALPSLSPTTHQSPGLQVWIQRSPSRSALRMPRSWRSASSASSARTAPRRSTTHRCCRSRSSAII
jgi:hypothetical protein